MKTSIGLGTASIGRPQYINIRQNKSGESLSSNFDLEEFKLAGSSFLQIAYELGIRYYDTAPGYGIAEGIIQNWKDTLNIEIATKWGYTYTANFDPNAAVHEVKEHSISKLKEQWKVSQHLLPQLSTYQIHSATLESSVLQNSDVLHELQRLKREHGLLIGLSTSGAKQNEIIEQAEEIRFDGKALFEAYQVTYNVFDQSLANIANQLLAKNKRIVVKEAMANGRIFQNEDYPEYQELYKYLDSLAAKYKVGTDAIALRFCIDSIEPFIVLSGASSKLQLKQNLMAYDFKLQKNEIEQLKTFSVSPAYYWKQRKQLNWN